MMGFKIVIFALLLISLQQAVGDPSKSSDDVEHSHHHLRRRRLADYLLRFFKRHKNKDNSQTQFSSSMKWGTYQENKENLVSVSMEDKEDNNYYISRDQECKPMFVDKEDNNLFLVNPNNIENLEWKPVLKHRVLPSRVTPPFTVETCDGYIIARNDQGLGYITAKSQKITITKSAQDVKNKRKILEVLTINFNNITEEYLTNFKFDTKSVQKNKNPSMLKNLTVVNNNCNEMKQMVKINNGLEETASFQTGNTVLIGGTLGIKKVFEASLKTDFAATETESNSNIKKTGYEYTQELAIPPGSSCNFVIDSTVVVTTVPFTADLTRVYKNYDVNTALVDGTYTYQESSEIKTNFESCTKLSDNKC